MTRPFLSVIVPAFNAEATIEETLRSVLAQTYRPIEVVVVDDGSTDRTRDVVARYGDGVRCVAQSNAGDAAARNRGIGEARGSLLAFIDADDLWREDKLEQQVGLLEGDATVGGVQCGALYVDDALRPFEARPAPSGRMDVLDVLLFRGLPAFSSAVVVRRGCMDRIGPIDVTVRGKDEWDLAIRVARSCGLASVADPLVIRRVHLTSASRQTAYAGGQVAPGLEILRRLYADPTLSPEIRRRRRRVYAAFYRMIAGSYARAGAWGPALAWSARAISTHPAEIAPIALMPARRARALLRPQRGPVA